MWQLGQMKTQVSFTQSDMDAKDVVGVIRIPNRLTSSQLKGDDPRWP